ncbi:hypothetical protein SLEP1_g37756 [Rubroshorea leprosula]|uniref:Polyprotein n=1 Tax=Rubroshorea leprosula TaxID=152421 RepID=A0AAV5KVN0_9ROSI|nr:hypothetical protein SLEP1_g37756 [Rubroshorea leprosula]
MASETFVQPAIPRFDGHYDHWSMLMENFLRSKEYWNVVESGVAEPTAGMSEAQKAELEALKLKDLKAKNYLFQAIDRTILETILCKDTSKQIWDSMKKKYQGTTKTKRQQLQALRSEFEILRMKEGETVTDYFSRTMAIVNKLRTHGDKTQDVTVVEKILRSMTPKYNFVVCAIEEANDLDEMSLDELESSLLVHERKLNRQDKEELALKVSTDHYSSTHKANRGRGRGNMDRRSHQTQSYDSQGRGRGRGKFHSATYKPKSADKSTVECYRCHRYGHYRSECRANLPKMDGEKSHFAETEEEISLLMVCHAREETNKNLWYLDTGCSNHMCGDKSVFSTLDESFRDTVKFGDNSKISVMGKGQVNIRTRDCATQTISNVLYVPELKTNLLSIGQLQERGYEIVIKNGVCRIHDNNLGLIAQATMTPNRMFPLHLKAPGQTCFSARLNDVAWLWHFRYGHLNFGGLKTLQQRAMVTGLPEFNSPSDVCEECVVSKQHRNPFPRGKSLRARKPLEVVHSDICGPINPASNGGKRYFITFIDDFSRKIWVYFLQHKSEAFVAFKSYKVLVEKEAGSPIKVLRTDRGGEYCSDEFAKFCDNKGIKRQITAAYTPQQNGVCERKNRTILDMVRSLLARSCIPKNFWPEAVNWSIHILNRSPTLAVKDMTPEEAWSGRKPTVDHLRIFGCVAYAHVPDQKRKKLDNKGEKCIFLGVGNQSKAYKLYNPSTKKIVISRDVVFDEEQIWPGSENGTTKCISADFDGGDDEEKQQSIENVQQQLDMDEQQPASTSNAQEDAQSPAAAKEDEQRSQRVRKRPAWMSDYEVTGIDHSEDTLTHFALFSDCDPTVFEEAATESKWQKAMDEEIAAIERNNTWELTELPKGKKAIGVKWVYKTKLKENGEIDKFKAHLVAKGYKQEFGIDYKEVYAPVARHDTIRLVIALAAQNSWPLYQLDVKSAFLHGDLDEEVFIHQPPGYVKAGNEHKVYKLKRALYGLKQAPRAWYSRIESYFLKEGFEKCPYEHTLFIKSEDGKMLIVCLYVDDLIYTGNDMVMFDKFKKSMMAEFEMSDLGLMHYYLGIEVNQSAAGIFISQKKYVQDILDRFRMKNCNPVSTPIEPGLKLVKNPGGKEINNTLYKQIMGSLMYLTATRPDIMHAVSLISRYMDCPKEVHLLAAKRILRYLQGTTEYGLFYKNGEKSELFGFTDSDFARDLDDRKSTSGYVFIMGTAAISWTSRKQSIVTLSTTEAEFVAATTCACQAIWLRKVLEELQVKQEGPMLIFCDNSSTIKLSKNPVLHGRCKHMDVKFHFLRDLTNEGVIDLVYCRSEDQIADIFTKPLKLSAFRRQRELLGVCIFDNN